MPVMSIVPVMSASALEAERKRTVDAQQQNPVIQGLAAHVDKRWESAKQAKIVAETRLLKCLRQRNGEYEPEKLEAIRAHGGSEVFMMLTSVKCRAAVAWLRDTLLGTGSDKPWGLSATPVPELPPDVVEDIRQQLAAQVVQHLMANGGTPPSMEQVRAQAQQMRDQATRRVTEEAKKRVERMELKMEDQLIEGGFTGAFAEFLDDIVTFPTALMKGPVPRKRKVLEWQGAGLVPVEKIVMEWERLNPFMAYPAAWATSPQDGPFIERHKLTRETVESMLGVPGFSDDALRQVLDNFGSQTLERLSVDQQEADATGKDNAETEASQEVVDALQLWDSVPGSLLVEWGVPETEIADGTKLYPCEVWKIGSLVVKAVLNYDPLGRRPYYAASFEKIPGAFWGNGVADLISDCQDMCNAAARALSNNMGISSGPQVGMNVSRLPPGAKVTSMYPWKVWQFQSSDYQDASKPIEFFQPQSNAAELMAVFEKFASLADEYSGIPRYLQGEHTPGVGRTSSGLSMLINNAGKGIKSVIATIDQNVLSKLLERQYQHNLRYSQDPDLIGDVTIVARGAMSLVTKEAAAVRRNEFLQLVLNNPMAQQIVGPVGAAELLRDAATLLDINVDKVVPSREAIEAQVTQQAMIQQAMLEASMNPDMEQVEFKRDDKGAVIGATKKKPKQLLPDGTPKGGREANQNANVVTGANT